MPTPDPRVDAYIERSADFAQPILKHLRAAVHKACPDVVETIKWGMPHFMHDGRNLAHMAAFKQHCGFGLWYGDARNEPRELGNAMGNFGRITSLADLPKAAELKRLLRSGAQAIAAGQASPASRKTATPKPPPEAPADLLAALQAHPAAQAFFAALPPSAQRDYIDWLTEAKREDTRQRRLATTVSQLAEGKRRNWKYEAC